MKLQHELNLVSTLILILLAVAVVTVGTIMITRTVYELNSRLLQLELENIMRKVQSIYNILLETDLASIDKYVVSAQREVVEGIRAEPDDRWGRVYIIDGARTVILHQDVPAGDKLDHEFADALLEQRSGFLEYIYQGEARFCVLQTFEPWDWTIALSISKKDMLAYQVAFVRIVTLVTGLILGGSIVTFLLFSRRITGSITRTLRGLREVEQGDLHVQIRPETNTEEIVTLQRGINSVIRKIRERTEELLQSNEEKMLIEKRLLEEEIQHKEAEISALQSQINPHFLYNTLECMSSIGAIHQVTEIQEISISLSNLFKYAIKGGKFVTVEEEIRSVEDYLRIQRIRFRDKFSVEMRVAPEVLDMRMLKFVLQPIIENSIFHGLEPKLGDGHLIVIGNFLDRFIELTVEDDGIGMEGSHLAALRTGLGGVQTAVAAPPGERRSIGLVNIQNRIRLVYGESYGLEVESRASIGTVVKMRLPRL